LYREQPHAFSKLHDVTVSGNNPVYMTRKEPNAARVGGDTAHHIHVDTDERSRAPGFNALQYLENIAAEHEDRRVLPRERILKRIIRPTHRRYDRVEPQRMKKSLRLSIIHLLHGWTLAFSFVCRDQSRPASSACSPSRSNILNLSPHNVSVRFGEVSVLGLGPVPGTLTLAVHSTDILSKLYSETLEAVPTRPLEVLSATGAGDFQTFLFGRLPQAMSGFTSLTLYQWECNIRSATILGFVDAGGIGQQILISMNLFDYPKVAMLVGATIIVVLLVDRLSAVVRRRLMY